MENATPQAPVSLAWKLVFFVPLVAAAALQLIAQKQTDLSAGNKLSILGSISLSVSLISYSVY